MATYRRRYISKVQSQATPYGTPPLHTVEVIRFHGRSSRELADRFTNTNNYNHYGYGLKTGIKELLQGRIDLAAQAEKLIDSFNEEILIDKREWQHTVAGFFPDVPTYLANDPECMWRLNNEPSDRTPLRIWIGVTSSGMISESQLIKRGAALAAFALALSHRRPVYISPYVNLGSGSMGSGTSTALISWDLATSPLVLSEVGACLASPNVMRDFGIAACKVLNPRVAGGWCAGYTNEEYMRSILNAADDDIYIPSITGWDPLLNDPIGWIKTNLAHLLNEDDSESED